MNTTEKIAITYAVFAVCVFMYVMSDMEVEKSKTERFVGALFIAVLWPLFAVAVPAVTAYEKIRGKR